MWGRLGVQEKEKERLRAERQQEYQLFLKVPSHRLLLCYSVLSAPPCFAVCCGFSFTFDIL
jgi:hypothetical protein